MLLNDSLLISIILVVLKIFLVSRTCNEPNITYNWHSISVCSGSFWILLLNEKSNEIYRVRIFVFLAQKGYCRISLPRPTKQVIGEWCISHCWLYPSHWNHSICPCTSWCQHSSSKAWLPSVRSSRSVWPPRSTPFRSSSWKGLGGGSWFCWISCRSQHCSYGYHQS